MADGGASIYISIGLAIASNAIGYALAQANRPKVPDPNPKLAGSEYGRPLPIVYGTVRVEGNYLWPDDPKIAFRIRRKRTGGKGLFGGGATQKKVYGTFHTAFCLGECTFEKLIVQGKTVLGGGASGEFGAKYIDTFSGSDTQSPWAIAEGKQGVGNIPGYRGIVGVGISELPLERYGDTFPTQISAIVTNDNGFDEVGEVLEDICVRAGYSVDLLDVTEGSGTFIRGISLPNSGAAYRELVEQILLTFQFLAVNLPDGRTAFRRAEREGAIAIPVYDFGIVDESSEGIASILKKTILDSRELPSKLFLKYINLDLDYNQDTVTAVYNGSEANENEQTFTTNIVLDAPTAATQAQRLLMQIWNQQTQYEFTLDRKWVETLTTGDVIVLPNGDRAQLIELSIGKNFTLECKAVYYDANAFAFSVDRDIEPRESINWIYRGENPAELFLLDTHLVGDTDTDNGIYVVTNYDETEIYLSEDGGSNYEILGTIPYYSPSGTCDNTLGGGVVGHLIDRKNTLNVTLTQGTLESVDDLSFLKLKNLAFVGKKVSDRWVGEFIGFQTPTLIDEFEYTLSTLIRGAYGTESYINSHTSGETFILLSGEEAYKLRAEGEFSDIGNELLAKGVLDDTEDFAALTAYPITPQGNGWQPWTPALISVTREANNDLTIVWAQRPRKNNQWLDGIDAIAVDPDTYTLTIEATTPRTVSVSGTSYTYTEADQITDYGAIADSFTMTLTQASNYVGSGETGTYNVVVNRRV